MYPNNSCESRAPPDPPRPRDRAKSHPHSSPRDPRRMNGRRSQTRLATIFKVALPETASNHYISFWLSGRALDSGQAERQFKSPCLCFFACFLLVFLLYVSSNPPCLLWKNILRSTRYVFFLLYCCTYEDEYRYTHGSWVVGGWVFCCFLPKKGIPGYFAKNRYILKPITNHTPGALRLASVTSHLFLAWKGQVHLVLSTLSTGIKQLSTVFGELWANRRPYISVPTRSIRRRIVMDW